MKNYNYKGFVIEKVTAKDWVIARIDEITK